MRSTMMAPKRLLARWATALLATVLALGAVGVLAPAPVAAAVPSPALTDIAVGWTSSCALASDGTIRCWGRNDRGQLGNGTALNSIVPVKVSGISTAVGVSVGYNHACARLASGTVRCWGAGDYGQLGNGSTRDRLAPVTVSGISTARSVSAGSRYSCAVMASGRVRCWGASNYGQLGSGSTAERKTTPVTVTGITTATSVAAGTFHTCARLASGSLRCWGYNGSGQVGDGTIMQRTTPVTVKGVTGAADVSTGAMASCATLVTGGIRCWGSGDYGKLGNGSRADATAAPVSVSGITNAVSVSVGDDETCARLADGTAACWGDNRGGQLGDGTNTQATTPVPVTGLKPVTRIAAGTNAVCAVLADLTARCWGTNFAGQVGDRTIQDRNVPVAVSWDPDLVKPVAQAPSVSLRAPLGSYQDKVRITIRWNGADDAAGTGIDHYDLQKSIDGGVRWTTIGHPRSRSRQVDLRATGSVRYRVRVWDRAANVSAWATGAVWRPRIVQQTSSSITWHGAWSTRQDAKYLGGSTRYTKQDGAWASYTFTGRSVAYVTSVGWTRGTVDVLVDGVLETTLDLDFPDQLPRWVAWARTWPTAGTHTVRLVAHVTPERPRVDLDGFVVVK